MPRKTNKTSHVLNLITNGATSETEENPGDQTLADQEEPVSQKQTEPAEKKEPVENRVNQTVTAETKEPEAKRTEDRESPPRMTASGDKTVVVVDETSKSHEISSQILDRLTDQLEEELQKKTENYHMVNVMEQILYRLNLPRSMEQYGVCMCSRCQADVMALILTRLPAKYVVVDESSTAPIIGYYESKFRVRILTEIIKGCIDVKENPRHDNSGPYDS